MAADLKPCPFCGSTAVELHNLVDPDDYFVACEECGVQQIANNTEGEAVRKWNTRVAA